MLTVNDTPTIRFAIQRRLDKEPGIDYVHTTFAKFPGSHITVLVELHLGWVGEKLFHMRSTFDLPDPFEHGHLLDEIDQVAEQAKAARKDYFGRGAGIVLNPQVQLAGTGQRGLWKRYGLRYDAERARRA